MNDSRTLGALTLEDALALSLVRSFEPDAMPASPADVDARAALLQWARTRSEALGGLWAARAWLTGRRPGALWALAGFLLGLGGAGLTAGSTLNVLAPPLLGLLAWQGATTLWLLARRLRTATANATATATANAAATANANEPPVLLKAMARRLAQRSFPERAAQAAVFCDLWFARAGHRLGARHGAALNFAAAALVTGAIAGLYLDGLATAYTARWESTFLSPETVRAWVSVLLGPSAFATGIQIPGVTAFTHQPSAGVPAAPWIHLWSTTLLAFGAAPRALLGLLDLRQGRRLVDIEADPWLHERLARLGGKALRLRLQPIGYRPSARSHEGLALLLLERFGADFVTDRAEPLPWHSEAPAVLLGGCDLVLMVSAAQTPEEEVHGRLLDACATRHRTLLIVDLDAYAATTERRASRLAAWTRLAAVHNVEAIHIGSES